jgi:hypothetical protein
MRPFENRVQRRMFEPKWGEIIKVGDCRKLHN